MKGKLSLVLLCCLAGCAADSARNDDRVVVEKKAYRTGSNIPVSSTHTADEARTISGEDLQRALNSSVNQLPNAPAGGR